MSFSFVMEYFKTDCRQCASNPAGSFLFGRQNLSAHPAFGGWRPLLLASSTAFRCVFSLFFATIRSSTVSTNINAFSILFQIKPRNLNYFCATTLTTAIFIAQNSIALDFVLYGKFVRSCTALCVISVRRLETLPS